MLVQSRTTGVTGIAISSILDLLEWLDAFSPETVFSDEPIKQH